MKTKITAILAVLAASVFAFAETNTEAAPAAPEKPQCAAPAQNCRKGAPKGKCARPQISPEQREAHVQRVLLSLNDEQLAKLAERIAEIRKMTPEQKAEAIKALPKPECRPGPRGPQGDRPHFRGHCKKGPEGKAPGQCSRGPRDAKRGCGCKGAPADLPPPPPPAEEAPAQDEAPAAE